MSFVEKEGGRIYLCFVHYIIFCISAPRIGLLPDSFKMGDASFPCEKLGAAGKKDAHALAELSVQLGYPAKPADIALRLEKLRRNPENHVFVVETALAPNEERLVAGFISFESYETIYCAAGINIMGFTVDEKLRRTGIGKSLMEAVEHFAEQNDFAFIRAESGAMRKDAHAVYRKLNFYSEKTQIRFLKKIERALLKFPKSE